jgi:hypothetical protein
LVLLRPIRPRMATQTAWPSAIDLVMSVASRPGRAGGCRLTSAFVHVRERETQKKYSARRRHAATASPGTRFGRSTLAHRQRR